MWRCVMARDANDVLQDGGNKAVRETQDIAVKAIPEQPRAGAVAKRSPTQRNLSSEEQAVAEINKDHAFINSRGGKARILYEGFDEKGKPQEFYYSLQDFPAIMAPRGGVPIGDNEYILKSKLWLLSPQRRT